MAEQTTLCSSFGKIWTGVPDVEHGFISAIKNPSTKAGGLTKAVPFKAVDFNFTGDIVTTVDEKGVVVLLYISTNRYARLAGKQAGGSAVKLGISAKRQAYIALQDGSVQVYDTHQMSRLATLKGHRSPVRHMSLRSSGDELVTVSSDCVLLWDLKNLTRKKALGTGPNSAVQAEYALDGNVLITVLKDDSFWLWDATSLTLLKKLEPAIPGSSQPACRTFCVSPDGAWMVAGGTAPLLFIWDLAAAELLYALHLPIPHSVYGTAQLHFMPDSQTVAAVGTDGVVRFVDVVEGKVCCCIEPATQKQACEKMALDRRGNYAALITQDGELHLYDLVAVRKQQMGTAQPLRRTSRMSLQQAGPCLPSSPSSPAKLIGTSTGKENAFAASGLKLDSKLVLPFQTNGARSKQPAGHSPKRHDSRRAADKETNADRKDDQDGSLVPNNQQCRVARLDPQGVQLNQHRLQELLLAYGEYPAKYRLLVWDFLLRLPHKSEAFQGLANMGMHPAYAHLEKDYPVGDRSLLRRLARTLSALTHWAPVLGEVAFLPALAFPFVRLFKADLESCFEVVASLLSNWGQHWFTHFPHPPLPVLGQVGELLAFHDPDLFQAMSSGPGGIEAHAWGLLSTALTEVLSKSDWLKLWDHIFSNSPPFLMFLLLSYLTYFRAQIMSAETMQQMEGITRRCNPLDLNKMIRHAYQLRDVTPEDVGPPAQALHPLACEDHHYPLFKHFPPSAVKLQIGERERIQAAEDALARRRKVVAKLEAQANCQAQQQRAFARERQQLSLLETERRAALRQHEDEVAAEAQRLDDVAKEQRLRQVESMEQAYQTQLQALKQQCAVEVESVKQEVQHKQRQAARLLKAKAEEEAIKALEFEAGQRNWLLQQDALHAAAETRLRQEVAASQAAVEAHRTNQLADWAAQEQEDALRLHQAGRRRAAEAAAEMEAAARAEAARLVLEKQLQQEADLQQVARERRLRKASEQAAQAAADSVDAERQRQAARAAQEATFLHLKADSDRAWYEGEAGRRQAAQAAAETQRQVEQAQRKVLYQDLQSAAVLRQKEAQLLEHRRQLERANAEEEQIAGEALQQVQTERQRDQDTNFQLLLQADEIKARLDHATAVGERQRVVEEEERAKMAALAEQMSSESAQREGEVRRRHEAAMAKLALSREQQILELDTAWRQRMQKEQVAHLAHAASASQARHQTTEQQLLQKERSAAKQVARLADQARRLQGRLHDFLPSQVPIQQQQTEGHCRVAPAEESMQAQLHPNSLAMMGKTQSNQISRREESASSQHSWSSGSTSSTASSELSDPDATLQFLRQSYGAPQPVVTAKGKYQGEAGAASAALPLSDGSGGELGSQAGHVEILR
ncbi:hypothetical protein WJX79_008487 [Trebouxia sp. C0005]